MRSRFLLIVLCFSLIPLNTGAAELHQISAAYSGQAGHPRSEEQTYLTLPEWYIVYSSDEYARSLARNRPSAFPYFGSIALFWEHYARVWRATRPYPFNYGYHLMIMVIGVSYSGELAIKGIYENTVGRLTEWTASLPTPQERFAAATAGDYVEFIRIRPWYEYPFRRKLRELWNQTNCRGPNKIRKCERTMWIGTEYAAKAVYAWLIGLATHSVYDAPAEETLLHARHVPLDFLKDSKVRTIRKESDGSWFLALPRYQPFTEYAQAFSKRGMQFVDIEGNKKILVTAIETGQTRPAYGQNFILFEFPIPIEADQKRLAYSVPVSSLSQMLMELDHAAVPIEHIYDF